MSDEDLRDDLQELVKECKTEAESFYSLPDNFLSARDYQKAVTLGSVSERLEALLAKHALVHYAPHGKNAVGKFYCGESEGGYTDNPQNVTCEGCKRASPGLWPIIDAPPRPYIVCLCGSTRFYDEFQRANFRETMAGRIVLSVGFYPHSQAKAHGEDVGITPEQKESLDELHKRKIDLADEILVLDVNSYIGSSTRSEIEYAMKHGKTVRYLSKETNERAPIYLTQQG